VKNKENMVSPLQRNAPEVIGLMGVGLLLFQHSKYIPIMKTSKWVQNIALRINTHFAFVPATLLSSGIFWRAGNMQVESLNRQLEEARSDSTQIREQLTRAQTANAENARQVESLNRQLEEARSDSAQIREQLMRAQSDSARLRRQLKGDLITLFPQEVLSKSCSYLSRSDIPAAARSCRKFNDSIQTPEVQSSLIEQLAFGPKDWQRFFGDVGEVPPIPEVMPEILKSQCPFNPGKQVRDTHMLVLIPQTVDGQPFTLNLLQELIGNPKEKAASRFKEYSRFKDYHDAVKDDLGDKQFGEAHWILMTKDIIPGSRNKKYREQKQLVQEKEVGGYELPSAIEAAASILMHYFKTDECLYGDPSTTYTRCQETVTENQLPVVIGGFSPGGLDVCGNWDAYDVFGVAAVRKF